MKRRTKRSTISNPLHPADEEENEANPRTKPSSYPRWRGNPSKFLHSIPFIPPMKRKTKLPQARNPLHNLDEEETRANSYAQSLSSADEEETRANSYAQSSSSRRWRGKQSWSPHKTLFITTMKRKPSNFSRSILFIPPIKRKTKLIPARTPLHNLDEEESRAISHAQSPSSQEQPLVLHQPSGI